MRVWRPRIVFSVAVYCAACGPKGYKGAQDEPSVPGAEYAAQAEENRARERRIRALKQGFEKRSAEAWWILAQDAYANKNYKEARDGFRAFVLHDTHDERALVAAHRAALSSFRLQAYQEGLVWLEDAVSLFTDDRDRARLRRVMGNVYLAIPHWGTTKGGTFHRGVYRQGRRQTTYKRDRAHAIRHLETARMLFARSAVPSGQAEAAQHFAEQVAIDFDLVAALARFTPYDDRWSYWYYAWETADDDLVSEPTPGGYGRFQNQLLHQTHPKGLPVDEDGNVIFESLPDAYAEGLSTTQKIKFLLSNIGQMDKTAKKSFAAQALVRQALLFNARDGAQRLNRLSGWWHQGARPFSKQIEGHSLWTLGDDEVLGLIATRIGVYRVPEDENVIHLLGRVVEAYPESGSIEAARYYRGVYFQTRQQYGRAIAEYEALEKKFPKGKFASEVAHQLRVIKQPGAHFKIPGALLAGRKTQIEIEHRNIEKVYAKAVKIDLPRFTKAFKADWIKHKKSGYRPIHYSLQQPSSYLLYQDQGQNYQKFARPGVKHFSFSLAAPEHRRRQKSETDIPISGQGLWAIFAYSDEALSKELSRALLMLESTAVVEKRGPDGRILWVVDAESGKPVRGAKVDVFEYWIDYQGGEQHIKHKSFKSKTSRAGLVKIGASNHQQLITVKHGGRYTYSGDGYFYAGYRPTHTKEGYTAMVVTDRPVYRPLQKVQAHAWLRQKRQGRYRPPLPNLRVGVEIYDARNTKIYEQAHKTDEYGGVAFDLVLKKTAALGLYMVRLKVDGRILTTGRAEFRVEEYKKPEFEVTVEAKDDVAKLGDPFSVSVKAEYYFGGPVPDAQVRYKVYRTTYTPSLLAPGRWDWLYGRGYGRAFYAYPWFSWWARWGGSGQWLGFGHRPEPPRVLVMEGKARLDREGRLAFKVHTDPVLKHFSDTDHRFIVEAEVTDASRRMIRGEGEVLATRSQFFASLEVEHGYYRTGETVVSLIRTFLPDGTPLATEGRVEVSRVAYVGDNGDTLEETPLVTKVVKTGEDGLGAFRWDATASGQYRITYRTQDPWGGEVLGTTLVWVWGRDLNGRRFRFNHLEVIADRRTYQVGETAKLLISSEVAGAHVLFSDKVDGGALLAPKVIRLQGKTRVVRVPITKAHVPNFFVEATLVGAGRVSGEARELLVPPQDSEILVSLKKTRSEFRAGREADLEVLTTTLGGKPTAAQVVLSVFDKSVLYIQPELTPDIRKHFWAQKRRHVIASRTNLKRSYATGHRLPRPDQQAFWVLQYATQSWMQAEVDFVGKKDEPPVLGQGFLSTSSRLELFESDADGQLGLQRELVPKKRSLKDDSNNKPKRGNRQKAIGARAPASLEAKVAEAPLEGGGFSKPTVRRRFLGTAAFRTVKTGADGRATVKWTFPDNLTTWRAKAWGMTKQTRVGEGSTELVTTKKLLVRLQAPRFFRERDRVMISANVHNRLGSDQRVKVELSVSDKLLKVDGPRVSWINVPHDEEKRVDFWVDVKDEGEAVVKVLALTEQESDAKELRFAALVHGVKKTIAKVGSISGAEGAGSVDRTFTLHVPEAIKKDQTELVVRWSPSLAGAMIDALPFLLDYPYGCTEQTMSRFMPAVLTRRALELAGGYTLEDIEKIRQDLNPQHLSSSSEEVRARRARQYKRFDRNPVYNTSVMNDIITTSLARLQKMQHASGGWGWWGRDGPSLYTSAYVLFGLHEAKEAGVSVPQAMISRGLAAMRTLVAEHLTHYEKHEWVSNTDAFFAYVMSLAEEKSDVLNGYLIARRAKLSVYGKSLLAMALWNLGDAKHAELLLENGLQFLKEDHENETAWVEGDGRQWWYWWNNDVETNATFLRALVTIRPRDPRAAKIVKWLLNHRQNGWYWRSTRDTAVTVAAFAHYMRSALEGQTDYDLELYMDGEKVKTVHIDGSNLLSFDGEFRLSGVAMTPGQHVFKIRRKGRGAVYFNAYLSYFSLEEDVGDAGLEIKVARRYYRLTRQDRVHQVHGHRGQRVDLKEAAYKKTLLRSQDTVSSGDLILVELMLESKNRYTFLAFEDPKPAGAESILLRSGSNHQEAVTHMELRDEKVVFFLRTLEQGKLKLEYRLRAEIPGAFHAMPARGFAMYAPELGANSKEMRLSITDARAD